MWWLESPLVGNSLGKRMMVVYADLVSQVSDCLETHTCQGKRFGRRATVAVEAVR